MKTCGWKNKIAQLPAVLDAVESGKIEMEMIDAAVERILTWKIELGIIE